MIPLMNLRRRKDCGDAFVHKRRSGSQRDQHPEITFSSHAADSGCVGVG
jgi:hypothetical protein